MLLTISIWVVSVLATVFLMALLQVKGSEELIILPPRFFWTPTDDLLDGWEHTAELTGALSAEAALDLIAACRRLKRANIDLLRRVSVAENRARARREGTPE